MPRIMLSDLVRLVETDAITPQQITDYFELDPTQSEGFTPRFRVNRANVDCGDLKLSTTNEIGNALAIEAERATSRKENLRILSSSTFTYIAEGDSWFSHPLTPMVIKELQRRGYRIHNLATPGDTIENMVAQEQYIPDLSTKTVTHFLFSGGGNDVIGRLSECLHVLDPVPLDPTKPADVAACIKMQVFVDILNNVMALYDKLVNHIYHASSSTILVVHGYAYVRPVPHGIFISPAFEKFLGWDLTSPNVEALAFAIIRVLVDKFNARLRRLAARSTLIRVEYVDFRQDVRQNVDADWYDHELHPSPTAVIRMADRYQRQVLPPSAAV